MQFTDSPDISEEEEEIEAFPVAIKKEPGHFKRTSTPYEKPPQDKEKAMQRTLEETEEWNRKMATIIDTTNQKDEEMKEVETPKKTRITKLFDYNARKDILQRKLDITLEQGCQLSPTIC